MDFFARQTATRRLSRRLVFLFVLAVVAVVVAVDAVVLTVIAAFQPDNVELAVPSSSWLASHPGTVVVTSLIVLSIIALASLYKTARLSGGGGVVARSMGGERVMPDTTDPLHRRLLNVVEEMSIASGVSMPEVYVLERETGINAFAAGHTPANAAIAVTRGALTTLNRAELQGVVAHEFSHILNGDMRLNIRLMGLLFGLLVIAMIARLVLRFAPRGGGDRKSGGAVVAIVLAAMAVLVIGYIGLFFGRLIQAAVSRGRESLADASAIQFTRDPSGLRAALVKIGAFEHGSALKEADPDEVQHMLFATGMSRVFATHPPLAERIRAIDPRFDPSEFDRARSRIEAQRIEAEAEAEAGADVGAAQKLERLIGTTVVAAPAVITELVANPGTAQIDAAQVIRASLPDGIVDAANRLEDAKAIFFALALDREAEPRTRQLAYVAEQMGMALATAVRGWLDQTDSLTAIQRQPALLRLLPTLRQLSRAERDSVLRCLNGLLQREGRVSLSAYALRKLAQVQLRDVAMTRPTAARMTLPSLSGELGVLFAVLAGQGNAGLEQARMAYEAGMHLLLPQHRPPYAPVQNWPLQLDVALNRLDRLMPAAKELLIQALVRTISHDGRLTVNEAELLRVVCATLHCPLPPLVGMEPDQEDWPPGTQGAQNGK